jgi:Ca2+-binding RTX toxin-like protein
MIGKARGGNDTLIGGLFTTSDILYGDSAMMSEKTHGGDDTLVARGAGQNHLYGDAGQMSGRAAGGNDSLTGSSNAFAWNYLYGDAEVLSDRTKGGDDILFAGGGASRNILYGDAFALSGFAKGGDDILYGAASVGSVAALYGDGFILEDNATGGNDRLVSGIGNDTMWGDAAVRSGGASGGYDVFVFAPHNGTDIIADFEQGKDLIELIGYGHTPTPISRFDDLTIFSQHQNQGSLIDFGDGNSILVLGVTVLTEADFILS